MDDSIQSFLFDEFQAEADAEPEAELAAIAAKLKAKEDAKAERDARKAKEEMEKSSRRRAREEAYRRKNPPGHAQCGINWYPMGSGWTNCHACGQALIYTTDKNAKPQECKGKWRWQSPPPPQQQPQNENSTLPGPILLPAA